MNLLETKELHKQYNMGATRSGCVGRRLSGNRTGGISCSQGPSGSGAHCLSLFRISPIVSKAE